MSVEARPAAVVAVPEIFAMRDTLWSPTARTATGQSWSPTVGTATGQPWPPTAGAIAGRLWLPAGHRMQTNHDTPGRIDGSAPRDASAAPLPIAHAGGQR